MQGGTITFWQVPDNVPRKSGKISKSGKNARKAYDGPDDRDELQDWLRKEQTRRRNKVISRLMHKIHTIKNTYRAFSTCILDKKIHPTISVTSFKAGLERFFRKLRGKFERPWFIYKIEPSGEERFHLHMLGAFVNQPIVDEARRMKLEKTTKILWDKSFRQEGSRKKTVVVKKFVPEHLSYMAKPSKHWDDKRCMMRLNGKKMWGIIGKEWIKYEKVVKNCISMRRFSKIIQDLIKHHKETHKTKYFTIQSKRTHGAIRGLDKAFMAALIKAMNDRKGI